MKIEKAVITAAGRGQGDLPLQTLVDLDGVSRSALEIVLREALDAGVKEVALVVNPEDEASYREAAGSCRESLTFLHQKTPQGYGHAIALAREFVGGDYFLHLVGDHLYVSNSGQGCARQLVEAADANDCTISAVQSTRESNLHLYGTIGGRRVSGRKDWYEVERVLEKPTPTQAEQSLVVPGLRAGHYLCFFGLHVLSPTVISILHGLLESADSPASITLSRALDVLLAKEKVMACEVSGDRRNIGISYGTFQAQLALALRGIDKAKVLADVVETLADSRNTTA